STSTSTSARSSAPGPLSMSGAPSMSGSIPIPSSGSPAGLAAVLVPALAEPLGLVVPRVVVPRALGRAFATPPRAPLVRVVPAAPSLAAEPAGRVFNSASLTAPLRAEGFLSAAARRDAGSAAATDGLSEQSVFGRGTEVGLPSASPPLEPA